MTPPAVAPAAPVSAPQTAAPPGGGPPNGSSPGGGLFGEILDSARTAVAEGQKETGTNTGDHSGEAKPSSAGGQRSSTPTGAQLIAAALSVLTGQKPADTAPSGLGKGAAAPAADAARPVAGSASGAPAAAGSSAAGSSAAGPVADSASAAAVKPAAAPAARPSADAGAAAQAAAGAAPAPAVTGTQPRPAANADGPATAPVLTGAYRPRPGTAAVQQQTATTAAAETGSQLGAAAASAAQPQTAGQGPADAAGQATTAQQPLAPRPQQVPGGPAADAGQVTTAVAAAAPGSTAANAQPRTEAPAGAAAAVSPVLAQATASGHTEHPGAGSDGHPANGGQPGGGSATPPPGGAAAGTPTPSAFSIPTPLVTGSAAAAQHAAKLPEGLVRTSVGLQEAVDAVKATFTAANHAGVSSARISLSPESLGGIKISLAQTPDGLIARVAADHPEAAQALQQSAADLRRTLEASGTPLLRLDIGSSGQQSLGGFAGSQGDATGARNWTGPGIAGAGEDATSTPTELTVELPNGSLVNVLA